MGRSRRVLDWLQGESRTHGIGVPRWFYWTLWDCGVLVIIVYFKITSSMERPSLWVVSAFSIAWVIGLRLLAPRLYRWYRGKEHEDG